MVGTDDSRLDEIVKMIRFSFSQPVVVAVLHMSAVFVEIKHCTCQMMKLAQVVSAWER